MENVFHDGELQVQRMAGVEKIASRVGRVIRNSIDPGAMHFISEQAMLVAASIDREGYVWPSLLLAEPGFTEILAHNALAINKTKIRSTPNDILHQNLEINTNIGLVFIELATRRRFRVNGNATIGDTFIHVEAQEAYGNCPKYIQRRTIPETTEKAANTSIFKGEVLTTYEQQMIKNADTFFIASQSKNGKLDASHRGGNVGFVEILANGSFKIPDYPGNNMYNTLGNIAQYPKTGLLFVNFSTGETLQVVGSGHLLFHQNAAEDDEKTGGTGRYWTFTPEKWIRTQQHHLGHWDYIDASPFNP